MSEVVEAAALSRPDVTFTLTRDGRKVRELLRARSREERVAQVESADDFAPCRGERGPLRVEAFLSRPEAARAGAGGLTLVVNGRTVNDRALKVAIAQAYGSVLERGRYPRGVVYLDLPPAFVDVNVHPQKAEVRFSDPRAASDALYGILSRALASAFSLPVPDRGAYARGPVVPAGPAPAFVPAAVSAGELSPDVVLTQAASAFVSGPEPDESAEGRAVLAVRDAASPAVTRSEVHWSNLRFVTQLRATYLLCEGEDGLYLLDQHAAAERVTFTRLRRDYQSRAVPAQALLFPTVIEVTPAEAEIVERSGKEIAEVGLDVRVRGPETVSIHAVPKLLQRGSPERLLRDLLSEVSRRGGRAFSDAVDLALATMACHGSIRAGDALAPNEVKALLSRARSRRLCRPLSARAAHRDGAFVGRARAQGRAALRRPAAKAPSKAGCSPASHSWRSSCRGTRARRAPFRDASRFVSVCRRVRHPETIRCASSRTVRNRRVIREVVSTDKPRKNRARALERHRRVSWAPILLSARVPRAHEPFSNAQTCSAKNKVQPRSALVVAPPRGMAEASWGRLPRRWPFVRACAPGMQLGWRARLAQRA